MVIIIFVLAACTFGAFSYVSIHHLFSKTLFHIDGLHKRTELRTHIPVESLQLIKWLLCNEKLGFISIITEVVDIITDVLLGYSLVSENHDDTNDDHNQSLLFIGVFSMLFAGTGAFCFLVKCVIQKYVSNLLSAIASTHLVF